MPNYTHDCSVCKFLGSVNPANGESVDLHYCPGENNNPDNATLIARFSDDGPDYISERRFTLKDYSDALLKLANKLAMERGL